jgi:cellulose biosynthesis protein BcsQ
MAHSTPLKNLFFVSPNIWSLDDEEAYLELMESDIDTFVSEVDRARNLYDTILIDCPPNLGAATRAALLASDSYLVPIQAEELCRDSLDRLLTFIQAFRDDAFAETALTPAEEINPPVGLEGMFLTMVSARTRMSRHVMTRVNEDYPDILFENYIPRTTRLTEMALRGKPAVIYDRKSAGSRAYFNLADELIERFKKRNGGDTVEDWGQTKNVTMSGSAEEQVSYPGFDKSELLDTESPELISLDEVLAEEEMKAGEENNWDDPSWEAGDKYNKKMH